MRLILTRIAKPPTEGPKDNAISVLSTSDDLMTLTIGVLDPKSGG